MSLHSQYVISLYRSRCKSNKKTDVATISRVHWEKCNSYFRKSLAAVNPTKLFAIPDWIPKSNDPSAEFNLFLPTYNKI